MNEKFLSTNTIVLCKKFLNFILLLKPSKKTNKMIITGINFKKYVIFFF